MKNNKLVGWECLTCGEKKIVDLNKEDFHSIQKCLKRIKENIIQQTGFQKNTPKIERSVYSDNPKRCGCDHHKKLRKKKYAKRSINSKN